MLNKVTCPCCLHVVYVVCPLCGCQRRDTDWNVGRMKKGVVPEGLAIAYNLVFAQYSRADMGIKEYDRVLDLRRQMCWEDLTDGC